MASILKVDSIGKTSGSTQDTMAGLTKVWQQALNRVYVQKSILLYCFDKLR